MFIHDMSQISVRRVRHMKNMQLGVMFFGQVKGMKKSDVGVFGKISTKQDIFIFYHKLTPSQLVR